MRPKWRDKGLQALYDLWRPLPRQFEIPFYDYHNLTITALPGRVFFGTWNLEDLLGFVHLCGGTNERGNIDKEFMEKPNVRNRI